MEKRKFIGYFLSRVFNEFKENIESRDNYCDLSDLRFNNNHIPDYSDKLIQQAYLLKYAFAYYFEYYNIYNEIIPKFTKEDDVNVLSIGSGCGLDYYALLASFEKYHLSIDKLNYTAVDKIEWSYSWDYGGNVSLINDSVVNLDKYQHSKYNIVIFPKSLGELDDDSFNYIKEFIEYTTDAKFYLINSLRASYKSDEEKFNNLIESIARLRGYTIEESDKKVKDFGDNPINYFNNEPMIYPDNIKEYFNNLFKNCSLYEECIESQQLYCNNLNWNIVLRTKHIRYQIADFYSEQIDDWDVPF